MALKVTQRDLVNKKVVTICCRFCEVLAQEKVDAHAKDHKPITTVKSWNGPFRTDHMRHHMINQHFERWKNTKSLMRRRTESILNLLCLRLKLLLLISLWRWAHQIKKIKTNRWCDFTRSWCATLSAIHGKRERACSNRLSAIARLKRSGGRAVIEEWPWIRWCAGGRQRE